MGLSPILSPIHTVTTGTMLNVITEGLKNVTCKQTLNSNWTAYTTSQVLVSRQIDKQTQRLLYATSVNRKAGIICCT